MSNLRHNDWIMFVFFVTEVWHGASFWLIIHSCTDWYPLHFTWCIFWCMIPFILQFLWLHLSILCLLSLSIFSDLKKQLREPSKTHGGFRAPLGSKISEIKNFYLEFRGTQRRRNRLVLGGNKSLFWRRPTRQVLSQELCLHAVLLSTQRHWITLISSCFLRFHSRYLPFPLHLIDFPWKDNAFPRDFLDKLFLWILWYS